jgi:hypothetical protein
MRKLEIVVGFLNLFFSQRLSDLLTGKMKSVFENPGTCQAFGALNDLK